MKEVKSYLIFLAIMLGILIGIVLTAKFNMNPQTTAEDSNQELLDMQNSAIRNNDDLNIASSISNTIAWVSQRSIPAVVSITVERTQRGSMTFDFFRGWQAPEQKVRGMGSGFFVSPDGYIVTNYHVVGGAEKIVVKLADDRDLKAEIIGEAKNLDLAIIKVEGTGYPTLEFGDSDDIRVGETVIAIGAPFGYRHTVTSGIISAQAFLSMKETQIEDFIQTDAAVNPGNSGGPLLNIFGNVIGVNTAISSKSGGYDGISFAIPSNIASFAFEAIRDHGKIQGGFIGVGIDDVGRRTATKANLTSIYGCYISKVLEDSPADKAGLKQGDIVLSVNGKKVRNSLSFYNMIYFHKPGDVVSLLVRRGKSDENIDIVVGKRTASLNSRYSNQRDNSEAIFGALLSEQSTRGGRVVLIKSVERGSICSKLSLRRGDVVLAINDNPIKSIDDFEEFMNEAVDDNSFSLKIQRNGVRLMIMLPEGIQTQNKHNNKDPEPEDLW